jgi:hypothetical protein
MMRMNTSVRCLLLLAAALLLLPATAAAETYGFGCITGNNLGDCAILEDQMTLEVTAGDSGTVNFRFANSGPESSSITHVFFSDLLPALLGLPSVITSSSGVSFGAGCSPGNLPGGTSYGFTTSYCADSNSPVQPNGVNSGEWLNIAYTLQGGATFDDVIGAIESGDYSVGIKVQGFETGGSEGAIAHVPEPSSLLFVMSGLLLVPGVPRRRPLRS